MPIVLRLVVLVSLAVPVAGYGQDRAIGETISAGAPPFSETLDQMARRDRQRGHGAAQPVVKAAPLFFGRLPRQGGLDAFAPLLAPPAESIVPAVPLAPQTIGTGFAGINLQDEFSTFGIGYYPPDTMGAAGPNHFFELINGSAAIYSKTGTRLSLVSLDSFFTVVDNGTSYPRNGTSDPRICYDRRSGRWFACTLELGVNAAGGGTKDNHIILAVCRTSDPTSGIWDKYVIKVGDPDSGGIFFFTDFDTLGVDDNGVYFGMRMFPSSGADVAKIAATPKAPLIAASPSLGAVTQWDGITSMGSSPQPAHNQDAVGPAGRAWFVSSSPTTAANVCYRTLTWSGGVPTLSSTITITTPAYASPINAPASGSTTSINVGDDRILTAVIRANHLWTSRNVGVNATGTASGANRTGCEWIELDVSGSSATLIQSGRVYDPASSQPRYYYYPTLMVNGQGHVAMGFSGSKSTEFVGAYTCGRLATDPAGAMGAVALVQAGQASYTRDDGSGRNRWGDFSYTSLDPNDDMSIWTIQEYATSTANIWGTWMAKLLSPAPTLNNPGGSADAGTTGVTLNLTGTGFYDPGSGYASRQSVALTGGTVNGIGNYAVTYNGPTSATVTFDIAANASAGPRTIVLTNPDGQPVSVAGGFTVTAVLSGAINLQDYAANKTLVPIPYELRNHAGGTVTGSVFLDTGGNYRIGGVAAGTYDVAFKASHWLRSVAANVTVGGNTTGINAAQINGDCDGDNSVTATDLSIIVAAMDATPVSPGWDSRADLDGDGEITSTDMAIVLKNLGLTGAL